MGIISIVLLKVEICFINTKIVTGSSLLKESASGIWGQTILGCAGIPYSAENLASLVPTH